MQGGGEQCVVSKFGFGPSFSWQSSGADRHETNKLQKKLINCRCYTWYDGNFRFLTRMVLNPIWGGRWELRENGASHGKGELCAQGTFSRLERKGSVRALRPAGHIQGHVSGTEWNPMKETESEVAGAGWSQIAQGFADFVRLCLKNNGYQCRFWSK